jgi:aryl carrier-like protein
MMAASTVRSARVCGKPSKLYLRPVKNQTSMGPSPIRILRLPHRWRAVGVSKAFLALVIPRAGRSEIAGNETHLMRR